MSEYYVTERLLIYSHLFPQISSSPQRASNGFWKYCALKQSNLRSSGHWLLASMLQTRRRPWCTLFSDSPQCALVEIQRNYMSVHRSDFLTCTPSINVNT